MKKFDSALFHPADILLYNGDLSNWAVIACDQFSSEPEYWDQVRLLVDDRESALNLILPEAWLESELEKEHQQKIHNSMEDYLKRDVFRKLPEALVYVERTLQDGSIRKGLVGAIDLEDYDFLPESSKPIKATEKTIIERIPPRKSIRSQAKIELPHILLLASDPDLELLDVKSDGLEKLYDFDLMMDGGRIRGFLLDEAATLDFGRRLKEYEAKKNPNNQTLFFAVGDGNHSLAAAKAYWDDLKDSVAENHPARFCLVELENLQDEAQKFEPIHRLVLIDEALPLLKELADENGNTELNYYINGNRYSIPFQVDPGVLFVAAFQEKLDEFAKTHDLKVDFIHDEDSLKALSTKQSAIGFVMPEIDKNALFSTIEQIGVLPRKTFSMGHAKEKRYYLEARKIIED